MSGQYCVDANIFITAWHSDYPPHIFSSLWEYIADSRDDIELIKPVLDEIEPISPADIRLPMDKKKRKYPLRIWLEETNFHVPDVSTDVNDASISLELEYETSNESKGAGQTDITLIAYAMLMGKTVVTFEANQPNTPGKKSNYKIPLICQNQSVDCINFISMLDKLSIKI